ncbi:hypothetical protein NDU88_007121 [Pleurodeles waltl]|uniref:Uncharacterized protein n=1 Tax=Pleurodeles waltl TaxID=8319 RepID=A0AAV7U2J6_PLEWA|nr:hypothetical protein NDU88_007121 [Pleurodeles waltl]
MGCKLRPSNGPLDKVQLMPRSLREGRLSVVLEWALTLSTGDTQRDIKVVAGRVTTTSPSLTAAPVSQLAWPRDNFAASTLGRGAWSGHDQRWAPRRWAAWRGWRRRGHTEGLPTITGPGAGDQQHGTAASLRGGCTLSPEQPRRAEDKIEACGETVRRSLE